MKISKDEIIQKREYAKELLEQIHNCQTEDELEVVNDRIEESVAAGLILKKHYRVLSEEIDNRLGYLIEQDLI